MGISIDLGLTEDFLVGFTKFLFPDQNPINTLYMMVLWLIIGFVLLTVFFGSSKRKLLWTKLPKGSKIFYSFLYGFSSFWIIAPIYISFLLFGIRLFEPASEIIVNLIFSIGIGFVLLAYSSSQKDFGSKFLPLTLYRIFFFCNMLSLTIFIFSLGIHNKIYTLPLAWLVVYITYLIPILKPKWIEKLYPKKK